MATTPNMLLPLPIIQATDDPTWSQDFLDGFNIIDGHNHTTGSGVKIPTAAIAIVSDFSFTGFSLANIASLQFNQQLSPLITTADVGKVYSVSDLYYNNYIGQQVLITFNGAVAPTAVGSFFGDYSSSGAIASYSTALNQFSYTTSTGVFSAMEGADQILTNISNFTITLSPSSLLATSAIVLTLPVSLPPSGPAQILTLDSTGTISFVPQLVTAMIADITITAGNFADITIDNTKIALTSILGSNLADGSVTQDKLIPGATALGISLGDTTSSPGDTYSGLEVSITSPVGRPVMIICDGQTSSVCAITIGSISFHVGSTPTAFYTLYKNGTPFQAQTQSDWKQNEPSTSGGVQTLPLSSLKFIDFSPGTGTNLYQLFFRVSPFISSYVPEATISIAAMAAYRL